MVLMKKGEDTRYVADIFIPHYLSRGYEVIFPKEKTEAPAPVVVEEKQDEKSKLGNDIEASANTIPSVKAESEVIEPVEEPIKETAEEEPTSVEEAPPAKKVLKCPVCGKEYSKNAYLLKHIEKAHPDN